MRGQWTGVCLALGAGLGLVVGLLGIDQWWWGLIGGAAVGLVVGAALEAQSKEKR